MRTSYLQRVVIRAGAAWTLAASILFSPAVVAQSTLPSSQDSQATQGPVRLRQTPADTADAAADPAAGPLPVNRTGNGAGLTSTPPSARADGLRQGEARQGEFELFVGLPRFGSDLVNEFATSAADYNPVVPPDYVIQTGDELQVALWGSVDADLRLTVDRSGRVTIPRVGPVLVAGVRYADLHDTLARRVGLVFRNFELSASLGKLRGVRVYVTGFVQRPGSYAVAGLSTVMSVVMRAGGPSSAGSFRQIELRRGGKAVANFDLYDLLLRGDRSGDRLVQPDDVIFVAAVGPQVALRGSVNKQAIYELKANETLRDLLTMAAGFSPVADRSRVALERLDNRNAQRVVQVELPANVDTPLVNGDVVRVFSAVEATLSIKRQNKRVRVDGEVSKPGEYVLPADSTIADALRAAGGLTPAAYLFAAQFTRESVRVTQQENFDRALRDLEADAARSTFGTRTGTADEAAAQNANAQATARLIERLRSVKPNGRVVLQLPSEGGELPPLTLEDGDRLYVPARPTTVGVFGSVFNTGSYLYSPGREVLDYLRLAGGPTRGADDRSIFVVRANGNVVSSLQSSGWFNKSGDLSALKAEPGDTIFVPEEMNKSTFIQTARDWTQIFFQLALGAAGLKTATGF